MGNALLIGLSRQIALQRELDVVANNIANLNTTGYKADGAVFEEFLMPTASDSSESQAIERLRHKTIKRVTEEYTHFRFNTALAALMEWGDRWLTEDGGPIGRQRGHRYDEIARDFVVIALQDGIRECHRKVTLLSGLDEGLQGDLGVRPAHQREGRLEQGWCLLEGAVVQARRLSDEGEHAHMDRGTRPDQTRDRYRAGSRVDRRHWHWHRPHGHGHRPHGHGHRPHHGGRGSGGMPPCRRGLAAQLQAPGRGARAGDEQRPDVRREKHGAGAAFNVHVGAAAVPGFGFFVTDFGFMPLCFGCGPAGCSCANTGLGSVTADADENTVIVQMVAFSEPNWQLERYLESMEEVGLTEAFLPALKGERDGRLWRSVPGRRWYSDQRGDTPGSQEVVFIHRKRSAASALRTARAVTAPLRPSA